MIWSVLTFAMSSGAATAVSVRNGSMATSERADVGELAGDGGGGGHRRAEQVGARALALAALEIAVRGRGAALARGDPVARHADAHRAAGFAPLEAGGDEDAVEPFGLGVALHLLRAGHHHGGHDRP